MNPTVTNFSVRGRAGDTIISTDFPRLAAQKAIRRAQIRRMDADYAARRANAAAAIIASLECRPRRLPMATSRPMATRTPARVNATRWALLVAGALAVAAIVLVVVA